MIIFLDTKRLQLSKLSSDILFKKLCLVECLCDSLVNNNIFRIVLLSVMLTGSWLFVYFLNGTNYASADTFYLSIILAALYWGPFGGIVVGLVSGIAVGPFMPHSVDEQLAQSFGGWSLRLIAYTSVGLYVGFLFRKIANKNKYISKQNSDLLKKNEEITSSRVNLLVKNEEIIKQRDIIQNQHHTIELQKADIQKFGTQIIECLTEAIEIRDAFTGGHSRRVAKLAYNIGKEMGLDEEEFCICNGQDCCMMLVRLAYRNPFSIKRQDFLNMNFP